MSRAGLSASALVLAAGLGVAACADDNGGDEGGGEAIDEARVVQLGAPGDTARVLTDDEIAELDTPGYNAADVFFVHGMLAHHEQALVMTALVADRTASTDLPLLAERMDVSQRDEIALMERWLDERGENVDDGRDHAEHAGGGLMPGMLTDEQIAALEAADGEEFDRLFLEGMILHHEGAIFMVQELLAGGVGGQEPEVFQLAQHIGSDQAIEIARMKEMLAARGG